jgi:hypothetical protein
MRTHRTYTLHPYAATASADTAALYNQADAAAGSNAMDAAPSRLTSEPGPIRVRFDRLSSQQSVQLALDDTHCFGQVDLRSSMLMRQPNGSQAPVQSVMQCAMAKERALSVLC